MSGNRGRARMQGNVLRGLYRLARGDAGGIREFGNTTTAFSASIAPLLAFPIVGSALIGINGHWILAAVIFLSRICGVLIQPVITEWSARRTGQGATWLMTSTALNWSIWLIFPLILAGVVLSGGLVSVGLPQPAATAVTIGLIVLYMFWYQWFILRAGLRLSVWRALSLLIAMNVAIGVVYGLPYALHPGLLRLILTSPAG
ncbi:hypothetical protein AiwAL_03985 [Acidiphilium sp. AL]|uniref:Uncharacterized protein n=1 Tax=Acidiphilium iwatense TaxID=768198 RepID=A0ABS9DT00_9PROT|nr:MULTISPECIES: hypothetical protein [Acidiphilium]MCF3945855.1 hypothetical protein [Acidiphilium iwatense]MCU4159264.1 hypothetical protein [Acidiphilium sp. AL]